MKSAALIFLICLLAFGCKEDSVVVQQEVFSPEPISNDLELTEGTAFVRIFDQAGKKVLEETVDAVGQSESDHIVFTKGNGELFAWIYLATSREFDKKWSSSSTWLVGPDKKAALVNINQRFYTLAGDWSYDGVNGTITIVDQNDEFIKGHFLVEMDVTPQPENAPGVVWSKNPDWGDHIIIEGRFFATPTVPQ